MVSWQQLQKNEECKSSIADRLLATRLQLVAKNRYYQKTIAEIILLCGQQEIAIRGRRESIKSRNRGNFLEILNLVANHDKKIRERIVCGLRNATYISSDIQNMLLQLMGDMVQNVIWRKIQEAGVFSVIADENKDCAKKEQLTIVLRCVDTKESVIYECFLTFVEAASFNVESLTEYIVNTLKKQHLDLMQIVSQGYDCASVMSGQCSGVQTRYKAFARSAVYIHCCAHVLNLVLVDSVKAIPDAARCFPLLESLYVFLSTTKSHVVFLEKQKELNSDKQPRELQRLSDTRWACRYRSVNAVCCTFDAVLATLEQISEHSSGDKATEATGLLLQMKCFRFLMCLITFDKLLLVIKGLSDVLQSPSLDLAKAADLVSATIETLQSFWNGHEWDHLYAYAESVASLHSIDLNGPRP